MAWYNFSCLCGVKLTALWAPAKRPVSETCDVTSYSGGWRKDGMNWCLRFEATIMVKDVWPPVEPVACCTMCFSNWHRFCVCFMLTVAISFHRVNLIICGMGVVPTMSFWVNEEGRLLLVFYTDCSHSFSSGEFDGLWHWCCTFGVCLSEWRRRKTFACVFHIDCNRSFLPSEFDGLWHWCTYNVCVSEWRRRNAFACVSCWLAVSFHQVNLMVCHTDVIHTCLSAGGEALWTPSLEESLLLQLSTQLSCERRRCAICRRLLDAP